MIRHAERGVTALFLVIFASVLLSIITISFSAMMVREQQNALNNNLSQSAYDSALGGTEDAKRVVAACRDGSAAACNAIDNRQCNTVQAAGINGGSGASDEVRIQSSATMGRELDQAYTCVIIDTLTDEYLGKAQNNDTVMVPLVGESDFASVRISWGTTDDIGAAFAQYGSDATKFPRVADWPTTSPGLLRTQLIQYSGGSLNPSDFDTPTGDTLASTLQLVPSATGLQAADFANAAAGRNTPNRPTPVRCASSLVVSRYACSVKITVPSSSNKTAFLRLVSLYKQSHFKVELLDSSDQIVRFDGVQPAVDATGRANDVYRRIEARLDVASDQSAAYPRATVDMLNNFCKSFSVTDDPSDYASGGCNPLSAG